MNILIKVTTVITSDKFTADIPISNLSSTIDSDQVMDAMMGISNEAGDFAVSNTKETKEKRTSIKLPTMTPFLMLL